MVTFDQFKASLLKKSVNFLLTPNFALLHDKCSPVYYPIVGAGFSESHQVDCQVMVGSSFCNLGLACVQREAGPQI